METAVGILSNALIQFVYVWLVREYFEIFLEKREKIGRKAEIAVWAAYYVLDWGISPFINFVSERIIYMLVSWFLLGFFLYRTRIRKLLLVVVSRYCIAVVDEFIIGLVFSIWLGSYPGFSFSPWAMSQIFLIFVLKVIRLIYKKKQREHVSNLDWLITILIPCGSIFIICTLLWLNLQNMNSRNVILSTGSNMVLVFMVLGIFFVYEKLGENAKREKINAVYAKELQAYQQQYEERELTWNEIRRYRHDYKNKMLCLKEFIRQDDMEGLVNYIERLQNEDEVGEQYWNNKCGNVAIDALLNSKIGNAHQLNIVIQTEVRVPPQLPFENIDLSVILGNALDNAIEATKAVHGGKIIVKLEYRQRNLFIKVSNPYIGEVRRNHKGEFVTTKTQEKDHGIGLLSIRKAVEKYHGLLEIETEDHVFNLRILLYSESV